MTDKQIRFIDEYMIDLNATQAGIRAGYSKKTAYSQGQALLKKPEIKAEIERRLNAAQGEKVASAQEILEYLSSVVRGEQQEEIVTFGDLGVERAEKAVKPSDRIKAAEILAKRYALFVDRAEVQVEPSSKLSEIIGQLNGTKE